MPLLAGPLNTSFWCHLPLGTPHPVGCGTRGSRKGPRWSGRGYADWGGRRGFDEKLSRSSSTCVWRLWFCLPPGFARAFLGVFAPLRETPLRLSTRGNQDRMGVRYAQSTRIKRHMVKRTQSEAVGHVVRTIVSVPSHMGGLETKQ